VQASSAASGIPLRRALIAVSLCMDIKANSSGSHAAQVRRACRTSLTFHGSSASSASAVHALGMLFEEITAVPHMSRGNRVCEQSQTLAVGARARYSLEVGGLRPILRLDREQRLELSRLARAVSTIARPRARKKADFAPNRGALA
jgi:hypothetical protein